MNAHTQDIMCIMKIDGDIPTDLLKKVCTQYIKAINCYNDVALLLINKMLKSIDLPLIENILDFTVTRHDLTRINGEQFINDNKDFLTMFYDLDDDFKYRYRTQRKVYIFTVLSGIYKKCNMQFKRDRRWHLISGKNTCETYYYV